MNVADFYDRMEPFYHLIFPDWEASIHRQAKQLDKVIREVWQRRPALVLDAACGIGTQTIGLADLGYTMTASDISPASVERCRREASQRGLQIRTKVADFRSLATDVEAQFELVIACDNAIPHLLSDDQIQLALEQMYMCLHPGGGCLLSVRDYAEYDKTTDAVQLYGMRVEGDTRYLVFQVREFRDDLYDVIFYFVEDHGEAHCETHVMRSTYYAISTDRLTALVEMAGFKDVRRIDDQYYQPLLLGTRP